MSVQYTEELRVEIDVDLDLKAIEELATDDFFLNAAEARTNLLLVALGAKPAYELQLFGTTRPRFVDPVLFRQLVAYRRGRPDYYDAANDVIAADVAGERRTMEGIYFGDEELPGEFFNRRNSVVAQLDDLASRTPFRVSSQRIAAVIRALGNNNLLYDYSSECFPRYYGRPLVKNGIPAGEEIYLPVNVLTFRVARDEETLRSLSVASAHCEAPVELKSLYGQLMGYPSTAIKSFCEGRAIIYPDEDSCPHAAFLNYKVSPTKGFQQREVAHAAKLADIVKIVSPTIYSQMNAAYAHAHSSWRAMPKA